MSEVTKIRIRPYIEESDRNFILSSFMKSYAAGAFRKHYHGALGPVAKIFMRGWNSIMLHLLKVRTIRVACLEDEPTIVVGYVVGQQFEEFTVIDWVYVKHKWRHNGIGRALCEEFDVSPGVSLIHTFESRVPHKMFGTHKGIVAHVPVAATLVWNEQLSKELVDGER